MTRDDIEITQTDLRQGMGIGGYDTKVTLRHIQSGCEVSYETHGGYPRSPFVMRERAFTVLQLLVEEYEQQCEGKFL